MPSGFYVSPIISLCKSYDPQDGRPLAPGAELCMEWNSLKNIERGPPKYPMKLGDNAPSGLGVEGV